MRVLVTGAAGFLGRAVVSSCLAAGHEVLALYRPANAPEHPLHERLTAISGDLREKGSWRSAIGDVEAVVHCAAATSGDLTAQLAGTVVATENLLAAIPGPLRRFVHVSTFSVYDYNQRLPGGRLTEQSALEPLPLRRDAYTQTKLIQEQLVRAYCERTGTSLAMIRPGLIYGPGHDWKFGALGRLAAFDVIFAPFSRLPLTFVENCADAIVAALDAPLAGSEVFNIVDDELPTRSRYRSLAARAGARHGFPLPVPYAFVLTLGFLSRLASKAVFQGRARLPELLDLPRQRVQWRRLRYSNRKARDGLGWQPRVSLEEGLRRTVSSD